MVHDRPSGFAGIVHGALKNALKNNYALWIMH